MLTLEWLKQYHFIAFANNDNQQYLFFHYGLTPCSSSCCSSDGCFNFITFKVLFEYGWKDISTWDTWLNRSPRPEMCFSHENTVAKFHIWLFRNEMSHSLIWAQSAMASSECVVYFLEIDTLNICELECQCWFWLLECRQWSSGLVVT